MSETPQISSTPWRREPAKVEASLAAWARWICKDDRANVSDVRMPESGMANDTVMFRLDGEALVARLAPAPGSAYPTFRTYDLGFQRRVIELVRARTKVPVPEIVHLEESADVDVGHVGDGQAVARVRQIAHGRRDSPDAEAARLRQRSADRRAQRE